LRERKSEEQFWKGQRERWKGDGAMGGEKETDRDKRYRRERESFGEREGEGGKREGKPGCRGETTDMRATEMRGGHGEETATYPSHNHEEKMKMKVMMMTGVPWPTVCA